MDYTFDGLMKAVWNVVGILITVADLAVVAVIAWFGLQMIFARGDEAKFAEAKKGLWYAIIGAVVIAGSGTIILTLRGFVDSLGR